MKWEPDFNFLDEYFTKAYMGNISAQGARSVIAHKQVCKYGIDYLDDQLTAIHPNEIILIGARSGVGKTTMVEHIITSNLDNGKKVAFFRLEGDATEFYDRQQYQMVKNMMKSDGKSTAFKFAEFRLGMTEDRTLKYENMAIDHLGKYLSNLHIYNNKIAMNNHALKHIIDYTADAGIDLIVIDHIHYFDWEEGTKEFEEEKKAMKTLKKCAEINGVPIIIVSHTRKGQGNIQKIVPDEDDYHGSSDKNKIAITSIMIGAFYSMYDEKNRIYATLIRILKSRNGASTNLVGLKLFDGHMNEYIDGYKVFTANSLMGKEKQEISSARDLNHVWNEGLKEWVAPKKTTQQSQGRKDTHG